MPLPYLIQQQKYNLTDEILERIRTYKDFNDLFDKLEKEDKNNQVVVEILDPNVSMISRDEENGTKAEIQDKRPSQNPDYLKGKKETERKAKRKRTAPRAAWIPIMWSTVMDSSPSRSWLPKTGTGLSANWPNRTRR